MADPIEAMARAIREELGEAPHGDLIEVARAAWKLALDHLARETSQVDNEYADTMLALARREILPG